MMDGSVVIGLQTNLSLGCGPEGSRSSSLNLTLQGGGVHGALTWVVVDRLLKDERIAFEGLSAARAGTAPVSVPRPRLPVSRLHEIGPPRAAAASGPGAWLSATSPCAPRIHPLLPLSGCRPM